MKGTKDVFNSFVRDYALDEIELLSNLVFQRLNQAATWSDCSISSPLINFTPSTIFARYAKPRSFRQFFSALAKLEHHVKHAVSGEAAL